MTVINSVPFETQLFPFNTAISWEENRREKQERNGFKVAKYNSATPPAFCSDLVPILTLTLEILYYKH